MVDRGDVPEAQQFPELSRLLPGLPPLLMDRIQECRIQSLVNAALDPMGILNPGSTEAAAIKKLDAAKLRGDIVGRGSREPVFIFTGLFLFSEPPVKIDHGTGCQ